MTEVKNTQDNVPTSSPTSSPIIPQSYTKTIKMIAKCGSVCGLAFTELAFYKRLLGMKKYPAGFPVLHDYKIDCDTLRLNLSHVGQTLHNYRWSTALDRRKEITDSIFRQGLQRIAFMRSIGFIHGDISSTNFTICGDTLSMIDFGGVSPLQGGKCVKTMGTYPAPENYSSVASEIWSFGWVMLIWITGASLSDFIVDTYVDFSKYESEHKIGRPKESEMDVLYGQRTFYENMKEDTLQKLIESCDNHIGKYSDVIGLMLRPDPEKRATLDFLCSIFGVKCEPPVELKIPKPVESKDSELYKRLAKEYTYEAYWDLLQYAVENLDMHIASALTIVGIMVDYGRCYGSMAIARYIARDYGLCGGKGDIRASNSTIVKDVCEFMQNIDYDFWSLCS